MKRLLLLVCIACLAFNGQSIAQTINMGTSPINFGNGCGFGQIQDLNGTRKLSIGGYQQCIGPVGGWTTVTVDYWNDRVGIGYTMTSPSYQLQLSKNSAAKPGSAYWTVVSDARFKKDIKPYVKGLDLIKAINPVYFKYNEVSGIADDSEFVGILAQELQAVAPDMVNNIPDPEDKEKDTEYLSADLSQLDFALVNSVKELDLELQQLKLEIAELREELRQAKSSKDLNLQGNNGALFIAPNPFQSDARVMYSLEEQTREASLEVYNMAGKLIHSEIIDAVKNGEIQISLDQYSTGSLVFKLLADGRVVDTQHIIQVK